MGTVKAMWFIRFSNLFSFFRPVVLGAKCYNVKMACDRGALYLVFCPGVYTLTNPEKQIKRLNQL